MLYLQNIAELLYTINSTLELKADILFNRIRA